MGAALSSAVRHSCLARAMAQQSMPKMLFFASMIIPSVVRSRMTLVNVSPFIFSKMQNLYASKFRGTADMIVQIVCNHAAALNIAMKMTVSNSSSAIRLISPQLLLAFHQFFNDAGGELPAHNAHTSSIVVFYCRHWSFWSVVVVICMPRTTYTLWLLHPR